MTSYLPVLAYDQEAGHKEGHVVHLAEDAGPGTPPSAAAESGGSLPQPPARQSPGPAPAAAAGGAAARHGGSSSGASTAAPANGQAAPRRPVKRLTPLEMRAKAVFRALEKLLEQGVESETQLWSVARVLSGDEYAQVAEERCLGGLCGNPLCSSPAPPPPSRSGGRYKIDVAERLVFEKDDEAEFFCSPACEAAVRAFATRLGSHAAAQHRFDALMQHAKQRAEQAQQGQQQQGQQQQGQQQQQQQQQPVGPLPATPVLPVPAPAEGMPLVKGRAASFKLPTPFSGAAAFTPSSSCASSLSEARGAGSGAQQAAAAAAAGAAMPEEATVAAAAPLPRLAGCTPALDRAGSSSSTVSSTSSAGGGGGRAYDEAEIRWAPGEMPQQWMAHRTMAPAGASSSSSSSSSTTTSSRQRPGAAGAGGAAAKPAGGPSPKGVLKQQPQRQFAAGTAKVPIMLAEVKERDPSMVVADTLRALPADADAGATAGRSPSSRAGPRAVEGYAPRAGKSEFKQLQKAAAATAQGQPGHSLGQQRSAAEGGSPMRRVRFSDEDGGSLEMPSAAELAAAAAEAGGGSSPPGEAAEPADVEAPAGPAERPEEGAAVGSREASQRHAAAAAVQAAPAAAKPPPVHPLAASGPVPLSELNGGANGSAAPSPVLVFDVEDPQGPLEATGAASGKAGGSLASQFGRLRVVDGNEAQAEPQQAAAVVARAPQPQPANLPAGAVDVEAQLVQQMQARMVRLFPRLSATLPAELDAQLEAELASDSEGGDDDADSVGWSSSSEDEAEGDDDGDAPSGRPRSAARMSLSFFGSLFTHLESWLTAATLEQLASPPGANPARGAPPLPPPSAHSAQIESVLARFLAGALPTLMQQLAIAAPRSEVERLLNELLHTMRFSGPLPSFKAAQWQLVALILLKALSVEHAPALRAAFETREGVQRLGKALAGLSFTIEEFYACLELLLPVD